MMKRLKLIAASLAAAAALLAQGALDPAKLAKQPTDSWPTYSGDYTGQRFSPLKKINSANVQNLSLAWLYRINLTGATATTFKGTPLVVNGVVIAHRGQAVVGRITEAQKAGRVEGVSRLGLEIIGITLADGENMSVHTRILQHSGPTSVGRDLGTVGQATAMGAAIGGISEGGKGAGIGAGVGAAAGLAGVLFTRSKATVVYPETLLTFELESAVEVDTTRSGAFRYADSRDYERDRNYSTRRTNPQPPPPPYYGGYGPGGYGPGWGYGYPYGGYRGGVGIIIGRGYRGRYGRR